MFEKTKYEEIDISLIEPEDNSRVEDNNVADLMGNIKKNGLLQPIGVYKDGKIYKLIYGYRRYYACKKLGWARIPCFVRKYAKGTKGKIVDNISENIVRKNISPVEIGRMIEKLQKQHMNLSEISARTGMPKSKIRACMTIYKKVPVEHRDMIKNYNGQRKRDGKLPITTLNAMVSMHLSKRDMGELFTLIHDNELNTSDVRYFMRLLKSGDLSVKQAWKLMKNTRIVDLKVPIYTNKAKKLAKKHNLSVNKLIKKALKGNVDITEIFAF